MEEKIKVSYDQIEKANKEIVTMKVGAGDYAKVSERVKAFRKVYPMGSIEPEIESITDTEVRMKATITDGNDNILAIARATEEKKAKGRMTINLTDMIENCETSAVGRALGFAGFGIDKEIASGEDMQKSRANGKKFEIFTDMYISDEEAKYVAKTVCADLTRKMGVVIASLNSTIYEELWTSLEEMTTRQLFRLEDKLKTLNSESNSWHGLYNENTKIKDVVPKNQEVIYETSTMKFGKMALEKAGTDELMRSEIINYYIERGVNLSE